MPSTQEAGSLPSSTESLDPPRDSFLTVLSRRLQQSSPEGAEGAASVEAILSGLQRAARHAPESGQTFSRTPSPADAFARPTRLDSDLSRHLFRLARPVAAAASQMGEHE